MLTAAGSPLVAGSVPENTMQQSTIAVRLLKPVWIDRKRHEPGETLSVTKVLAAEIIGSNKARLAPAPEVSETKEPDTPAGGKKK